MQDKMKKWYLDSFKQYGKGDFRSLTWGDKEGKSAKRRYEQMSKYVDFEISSVYEIGCGWGSFFDFGFNCLEYYGIDVIQEFVDIADYTYGNLNTKFENKDFKETTYLKPKFDVAISSGVAGNRGGPAWKPDMLYDFLKHISDSAKVSMVNFPSIYATLRTENVEYFSPEYLLSTALKITEDVELIHKHKFDTLLVMRNNEDN